jgi:hypothetical protein
VPALKPEKLKPANWLDGTVPSGRASKSIKLGLATEASQDASLVCVVNAACAASGHKAAAVATAATATLNVLMCSENAARHEDRERGLWRGLNWAVVWSCMALAPGWGSQFMSAAAKLLAWRPGADTSALTTETQSPPGTCHPQQKKWVPLRLLGGAAICPCHGWRVVQAGGSAQLV